jgi:VIT1/CCC1 family predicted Fe2+/Mn2+ transporter
VLTPSGARIPVVAALALVVLAGTGALAGRFGGAPVGRAALRVLAGGSAAMLVTWLIGTLIGTAV